MCGAHSPLPPTLHSGHIHSWLYWLRVVCVAVRQRLWYEAGQPSQHMRLPPRPHSTHSLALSSFEPACEGKKKGGDIKRGQHRVDIDREGI